MWRANANFVIVLEANISCYIVLYIVHDAAALVKPLLVSLIVIMLPIIRLGIWHVKVCEFVDIFCAHPSKRRPNGKQNQQIFTNPNMSNPKYDYDKHRKCHEKPRSFVI